ncbi:MAG: Holliday junction branch migration protein RuvA [Synechococcaceae cyanobacterium]|nr:Holliday junction branch migration protein RuvA [Synechococcaceae cyanobacterium]
MIGWLRGELADPWQQGSRCGALLVCQGVGYEVQLCLRSWQRLPPPDSTVVLHVHQAVREDGWTLYGFEQRQERDLFRDLISVRGVGPQMALGLLSEMEPDALVRAIVRADLSRLSRAPGVGKRTAERLAVELRARLQERFALPEAHLVDLHAAGGSGPDDAVHREVCTTLEALGYETLEIQRALRAAAAAGCEADHDAERWLRSALAWLARDEGVA